MSKYFDLILAMTEKEIKARYKRAIFGFLWVILNPLLQMLIIGIIFSFFIKIPDYFLFLFSGLLPWTFFSLSLAKATPSIVYERALLKKAKFSIESIPISIILANFFNLIISLGLLIVVLFAMDKILFPQILLIIPAILWLLIFTIGLSLLTATLQVRFRDINFFISTLLLLWFYATPILYNVSLIPTSLHALFALNPLTSIIEIVHFSFLNQGIIGYQIILINLGISLVLVLAGIIVFIRERKFFVDRL